MDIDSKPMSSHNFPRFQIKSCFLLGLGLLDLAVSINTLKVYSFGAFTGTSLTIFDSLNLLTILHQSKSKPSLWITRSGLIDHEHWDRKDQWRVLIERLKKAMIGVVRYLSKQ